MGHYRSEMGFEAEDRKAAERREAQHKKLVGYIHRDIKNRSIELVLADIVTDPKEYGRRAR